MQGPRQVDLALFQVPCPFILIISTLSAHVKNISPFLLCLMPSLLVVAEWWPQCGKRRGRRTVGNQIFHASLISDSGSPSHKRNQSYFCHVWLKGCLLVNRRLYVTDNRQASGGSGTVAKWGNGLEEGRRRRGAVISFQTALSCAGNCLATTHGPVALSMFSLHISLVQEGSHEMVASQ